MVMVLFELLGHCKVYHWCVSGVIAQHIDCFRNTRMWEQLTILFEFLYKYACCVLLYLHKPWRFNSCKILFCSVGECINASMFILICFACLKLVSGCIIVLLGGLVVGYDLAVYLFLGFELRVGCTFVTLFWGVILTQSTNSDLYLS